MRNLQLGPTLVCLILAGCCEDGGCATLTGYSTSTADLHWMSVPADFNHYYCLGADAPWVECDYVGDKNIPSGVACPMSDQGATGVRYFLGALERVRVIKGCEFNDLQHDVDIAIVDSGTITGRLDKNSADSGPIEITGSLCFRSISGMSVAVENYDGDYECDGTPSSATHGGIERVCELPQCGDGSFCPAPGACTACQFDETCLFPGQRCALPCGAGECDRTALCVRCGSLNPYDACLAPGETCP